MGEYYLAVLVFWIINYCSCNGAAADGYSSLRKDYYLPKSLYDESFVKKNPDSGGRGHIVWTDATINNISLPLTVSFNNNKLRATVSPSFNLMPTGLDWIHCDYKVNTELNTISYAVTFHTQSDTVISDIGSSLVITDNKKKEITSTTFKFPPVGKDFSNNYPLWVTYVATSNNYTNMYVHLHNYDPSTTYTINKLSLNGVVIDNNNNIDIPANSHLLRQYNPTKYKLKFTEGDLWTLELAVTGSGSTVNLGYGGRLMKEFTAFESYFKSGQCPFPGANTKNYELLWNELKIQTGFCQSGGNICNVPINSILSASMQTPEGYKVLMGETWSKSPGKFDLKYCPAIIGLEMGDEVDSHYNNTYAQWVKALNRRMWFPKLVTFQGSHVNHYVGAFAGITDIQSVDYYVAGCAPHVTSSLSDVRIQGSRDYLWNTRQNHKPLVTWGYTQAFYSHPIHGNEYLVQLASVFAAGCKGVQLFQSDVTQESSNSDEWSAAQKIMATMYTLKEHFRVGDLMEMEIEVNGKAIVNEDPQIINVIRSDAMLVIIVINTDCHGYNGVACTGKTHWEWKSLNIDKVQININVKDLQLTKSNNMISEMKNGKIEPSQNNVVNGVTFVYNTGDHFFTLENVDMGQDPTVVRVFIVPVVNQP